MELIVTRADNSNYNLPSENSKITNAVQTRTLMGEDTVVMTVQSVGYINFLIGDWIEVFGRKYTLNTLGEPQRIGENTFEYNLVFEGVNYELTKVVYRSADYSGFNPTSDFPLTGTAEAFLTVLQYNLERAFGQGVWAIGSFPATEAKTLSFTSENCLLALNRVCSEFGLEYEIKTIGGVKTINLGAVGDTLPLNLEYGKGKGLYSLTRTNVDSKNIVTRLYVEGSDRNVKAGYRDNALRLRIAANAESYIDSASAASFGIIEGSKIFEDILPHREGTVSAINASDVLEFTDSSMDFDLAEADSNGTKWLIAGQSAKIHFNNGALAGYEFELTAYNHSTKTFKLKPFKDERGLQFPNPDSAAFQIKTGDKYVILDIIMPDAYIQAAEAELLAWGQEYLSQNDQPRVEYSLDLDRFFLKSMFSGPGFDVNFLDAGDYLHIKDSKIGVDKEVRVKTFTRDVIDPWVYQVSLSDVIEPTRIELLLADTLETKKAARQSKLFDPARTRRNWRDVEEVAGMVDTLRAEVALIGSPEGQFQVDSFFEVNKGGNPDSFGATAGVLAHDAFEGDAGSVWNIGAFDVALSNSGAYYLYAKCSRVNAGAVFTVSLTKIGVEDVGGYYHFPVGLISSKRDNSRTLTTTYGYTLISGNNISTGIIKNENSGIMINLETGDIQGKFKFTSGQSVEDAIVDQQIYVEYSVNGSTNWHTTFAAGDLYMRQKKGAGAWSAAIRIVGVDGTSGTDGRSVSGMTTEFYLSTSKTSRTGGSWLPNPPDWEAGKYLWTRVVITYANPTSTAYTTPVVSSEWEAINSIQIGGRNLVEKTNQGMTNLGIESSAGAATWTASEEIVDGVRCAKGTKTVSTAETWALFHLRIYTPSKFRANQQYAISFKIKPSFAVNNQVTGLSTLTNQLLSTISGTYSLLAGEWNHIKLVVATLPNFDTILAGRPSVHLRLNIPGNSSTGDTVLLKDVMIEEGNKASAYAPAPEDVTAEILSAKQEALTAAGNAQSTANSANTAVGNLSGYVDGAFKDGVIDAAEAKAIEKYKNTLNEAMAKAESSYLKVYTNTYLSGAPKTALQNAKINLWGQRDTLIGAINTAIAGGTTTASQKLAVDNAFTSFNSLMAAFQNALEEANKAIQVKLDDIAKGYVEDIEVGGQNLALETNQGTKNWVWGMQVGGYTATEHIEDGVSCCKLSRNSTPHSGWSYGGYTKIGRDKLERGETYMITFDVFTNKASTLLLYFRAVNTQYELISLWDYKNNTCAANTWSRIVLKATLLQTFPPETNQILYISGLNTDTNAYYIFRNLKIEKGNKRTNWTPAPEDVPSALEYLATAIQDGSTDIEGGLTMTNLLLLKNLAGEITGGMSGLDDDNVLLFGGGDYQAALDSAVQTLIRKDGTGLLGGGRIQWNLAGLKVGDLDIDSSGAVLLRESGVLKLLITKDTITSPEALIGGGQSSETSFTSTTNTATGVTEVTKGTYTINNNGTEVTVITTFNALLQLSQPNGYSTATIQIIARYPSSGNEYIIDQYSLTASGTTDEITGSKSVNATTILPAGTMYLIVRFGNVNSVPGAPAGFVCSASAGTIKIFRSASNSRSEIGKNGFMFGKDSYNFAYFGVDNSNKFRAVLRSTGDFDMPGVLLRGTVESLGGSSTANWWGPKKAGTSVSRTSTGRYVIYHSVGHVNYTVTAASRTENRSYHIVSKGDMQFIIEWRTIGSSPTLNDTTFDFTISGQNFLAP